MNVILTRLQYVVYWVGGGEDGRQQSDYSLYWIAFVYIVSTISLKVNFNPLHILGGQVARKHQKELKKRKLALYNWSIFYIN